MTEQEKLQCIEDMGIKINEKCPDDYLIKIKRCVICDGVKRTSLEMHNLCCKCWIKTLEEKP